MTIIHPDIYVAILEMPIQNEWFIIKVTDFEYEPPCGRPAHRCDSDIDYYGWFSTAYEIWDYGNERREDVEASLSIKDEVEIEEVIKKFLTRKGAL